MSNAARVLESQVSTPTILKDFHDEGMQRIMRLAEQASQATSSLLISGEIGTGRKTIAKYIAALYKNHQPYYLDCKASDPTNTDQYIHSFFTSQDCSVLILDNIETLSLPTQNKLNMYLSVQVESRNPKRIFAITTEDLTQKIAQGFFVKELYYRINMTRLNMPTLKKRKADLQMMAKFFLENHDLGADYQKLKFTHDAYETIIKHNWPGNLIELKNVVHRAIMLSTSYEIDKSCLEIDVEAKPDSSWIGSLPIGLSMKEVETQFIIETLKHHQGNRTHCAKTLGISLRTLRNKINEFRTEGLEVAEATTGKAFD